MYLTTAIFFTILAVAMGLVGALGKVALAVTNPIVFALAFLGCTLAAISFFMRHMRSQIAIRAPGPMSQTQDGSAKFWTWLSRISSVVGLLAGVLSFGKQIYEIFLGG